MLTGRRAFEGEETSDILAAVLRQDVDWKALPAATPPAVRRLLRRCIEKDPRRRLSAIGDARLELDDTESAVATGQPAPTVRRSMTRWFWPALAGTALIVAAVASAQAGAPSSAGRGPLHHSAPGFRAARHARYPRPQRRTRRRGPRRAATRLRGRRRRQHPALRARDGRPDAAGPPGHRGRTSPVLLSRREVGRIFRRRETQEDPDSRRHTRHPRGCAHWLRRQLESIGRDRLRAQRLVGRLSRVRRWRYATGPHHARLRGR